MILTHYCDRYKCRMTEQACKRYQMHEYGQACSGCDQMQIPKINFVQEGHNCWHYVKLCVFCGTEEPTRFRKGFNRVCERCRKSNVDAVVSHPFNPSIREIPKKEVKIKEEKVKIEKLPKEAKPLKYGAKKGEIITVTCPDCNKKREIKFIKVKQAQSLVRCQSCSKKIPMSLCRKCGKRTRIYPENVKRLSLQLCIDCMKENL